MATRTALLIVLLSGVSALSENAPTCTADGCPEKLSETDTEHFEAVETGASQFELMQRNTKVGQLKKHDAATTDIHILAVDDIVVAKWPTYRGRSDNPWFAAKISEVNLTSQRCSVKYEDGDFSSDVKEHEVMYSPTRSSSWRSDNLPAGIVVPIAFTPYEFIALGKGACRDSTDKYLPWGGLETTNENAKARCAARADCQGYMNDRPEYNAASYSQFYCTNQNTNGICNSPGDGGGTITKGRNSSSTRVCFKRVSHFIYIGQGACRDNVGKYLPWGASSSTNEDARAKCAADATCQGYYNGGPALTAASYSQYYCTSKSGICDRDGNGGGSIRKGGNSTSTHICFSKAS